jgi:hypothetical protein
MEQDEIACPSFDLRLSADPMEQPALGCNLPCMVRDLNLQRDNGLDLGTLNTKWMPSWIQVIQCHRDQGVESGKTGDLRCHGWPRTPEHVRLRTWMCWTHDLINRSLRHTWIFNQHSAVTSSSRIWDGKLLQYHILPIWWALGWVRETLR